ncbi:glutathione S-transferase TAU 19 [Actinidia rufa]|uniref:Glutathione S-transferase n=1 Tax=Actinidia rufa TaxID=165716 RepID=A0A7J0DJ56_9ERIC|nr:glutathione S-transferase TAU 19 [Actinidia rufa]
MSTGDVVVLDFWVSPFCLRVKMALAEKGVAYETQEEDLFGGKSELLVKSNPIYQKVPVLLHGGKAVCESTNILSYIDETWPSPPLLPPCTYGRAQARFWADFIDKKVFEEGNALWRTKGEEQEAAKKIFIETLKQLERALGDNDYFGGATFGFVDIMLVPLTFWFYAYEKFGTFNLGDHLPKLSSWIKKCMERESVSTLLPDPEKVHEFVIMVRKMRGFE